MKKYLFYTLIFILLFLVIYFITAFNLISVEAVNKEIKKPVYNDDCVKKLRNGIDKNKDLSIQKFQSDQMKWCIIDLIKPITSGDYYPEDIINGSKLNLNQIIFWHEQMSSNFNIETLPDGKKKIIKIK